MAEERSSARNPAAALGQILNAFTKKKRADEDLKLEMFKQRMKGDEDFTRDIAKMGMQNKLQQKRSQDKFKWEQKQKDTARTNKAVQLGRYKILQRQGKLDEDGSAIMKSLEYDLYGQVSPQQQTGGVPQTYGSQNQPQGHPQNIQQNDEQPMKPSQQIEGVEQGVPKDFVKVQTGYDKMGNPKYTTYKNPEADVYRKSQQGIKEKADTAESTFNIIESSATGLMDYWAKGYEEGGMGNRAKQMLSSMAGWVGGSWGDQYPNTAAFVGQRGEMALKMMPLLTGSVRIVQSVFKYLLKSLPDENDGPATARAKMEQTVRNMYGINKAAQRMGITPEQIDNMSDDEANALGNKLIQAINDITSDEESEIQRRVKNVLKPVDDIIARRSEGKKQTKQKPENDPFGLFT